MNNKIPRTGRIGRFAKIVEQQTDQETLERVMERSHNYQSFDDSGKAEWWAGAVVRLETVVGKENAVKIMKACGSKCCGNGQRKIAVRLKQESDSIEEFLEKASNYGVKSGEIEYRLKEPGTIIGKFHRCFCGQVKKSKKQFKSDTYCNCSVEFHRRFFEAAFDKPVDVKLISSILYGADNCEFLIKY